MFGYVGEELHACQICHKRARIMFFGIFCMHVALHLHALGELPDLVAGHILVSAEEATASHGLRGSSSRF